MASVVAARPVNGNGRRTADPKWAAIERLSYSLAAAMDAAERKGDLYAPAQLAPRLLDVLRDMMLTPASVQAGQDDDDLGELLAGLTAPAMGDTP